MSEDIQAHIDRLNQQIDQLTEQQQFKEAIVLATSTLDFVRHRIGEQSTWLTQSLNNLVLLYHDVGEYPKAEPLLEQALAIKRTILREEHPDVVGSLNDLAVHNDDMGGVRHGGAVVPTSLGDQHPDIAGRLNNLLMLYKNIEEYGNTEPLLEQALAMSRIVLGEQRPDVALFLSNLASVRVALGRNADGSSLLLQALAIEDQMTYRLIPALPLMTHC